MTAKIAINGDGTIGKRVADAVAAQDDMRVAGVAKTKPDFEAKLAIRKGYPLYAANADVASKFEKAGVKTAGTLEDLVKAADLVVDCTPEESGYKSLYEKAGVKAIWQGGEDHGLWKRVPRVAFVSGGDGVKSTAQIMEMARDLSRNRADLYEIAVWRDGVHVVDGKRLFYFQAVHQESDVVPENVDAIRALLEIQRDGRKSMEKTDQSLGIGIVK